MRRQINRVFCATDFSDFAKDVVAYGVTLAKEFHAKLYVCHVIDLPAAATYGEAVTVPIENQNRFMGYARREIERLIGNAPIEFQPLITIGNTTEEIARLAEEQMADLVITATHGRSGLKRFFLGSVTERLMRTLPCPMLVIRGAEEKSGPKQHKKFPFKRVLVGCDFSSDSEYALDYSISIAQEFESELHLVHVVEPTGYKDLFKLSSDPGERFKEELYDTIQDKLKTLVPQEALNWITLKTKLLVGKPYEELVRYAQLKDMDLIALGTRGRGMVEEILVGSTTDRVIRQAPCPVLSIASK
ncbi:MAG: universal stress protein [Desulfobacterales bacterium]|jgi:nucleotide-binding universal stress UspA family protein|nr:universal stress protein [Desulfobacterales bacterium]